MLSHFFFLIPHYDCICHFLSSFNQGETQTSLVPTSYKSTIPDNMSLIASLNKTTYLHKSKSVMYGSKDSERRNITKLFPSYYGLPLPIGLFLRSRNSRCLLDPRIIVIIFLFFFSFFK